MAPGSIAGIETRPPPAIHRFIGRIPLAFAVAVFAAVSLVGPTAAAQPFVTRNIVDGPHIDVIDCGTFSATVERTLYGTATVFFDQHGQALRLQVVANAVGTVTSDTTGTVVNLRGHILFVIDFIKGTYTFKGQVFMANRPGVGVVLQDTGKQVSDDNGVIFQAGPHDVTDIGGAVFCAAVA